MKKTDILGNLEKAGVIAVVRAATAQEALDSCDALVAGGVNGLELTFTVPNADQVIKTLSEKYAGTDVVVGAGTVLDSITARLAIMAGAQYVVSPSFDLATSKICNLYQIPYLPGCMTVTEIKNAMENGVDIVKLFPGSAFGPDFVKAVKAPLPHANIMPTGGVNLDNMADWFANGVITVGVGGSLVSGTPAQITEKAAKYIAKLNEIKGNN
ncbi:MAG: bifunctional 2-keto-4-hydroxyglutarate aldolase/2-keto-3-deoxy-6-phosphogluconate aldolase [Lactobacillaceae bacterium]|jgi:2-dehydro-3-deoxyphosphogluconate aldolase/(4S)-4-hydroxy-2-oxoglutarate aldolase|nr:bifunctional 2-keto-4-hydroxyglutarate aldolase/2-keto-3-deoxy-6-phosphogluconate aldolase [Lactobacillaceae bacterium]